MRPFLLALALSSTLAAAGPLPSTTTTPTPTTPASNTSLQASAAAAIIDAIVSDIDSNIPAPPTNMTIPPDVMTVLLELKDVYDSLQRNDTNNNTIITKRIDWRGDARAFWKFIKNTAKSPGLHSRALDGSPSDSSTPPAAVTTLLPLSPNDVKILLQLQSVAESKNQTLPPLTSESLAQLESTSDSLHPNNTTKANRTADASVVEKRADSETLSPDQTEALNWRVAQYNSFNNEIIHELDWEKAHLFLAKRGRFWRWLAEGATCEPDQLVCLSLKQRRSLVSGGVEEVKVVDKRGFLDWLRRAADAPRIVA